MPAGKFLDAVSLLPGCSGQQSDAVSAYTQTLLYGDGRTTPVDTWVSIPKDRWPKKEDKPELRAKFESCKRPVVRLRLALYGHPLSGLFWERHVQKCLIANGWTPIPDWECCYTHRGLGLVLSVYVDDFKMAGKTENLARGWETMKDLSLIHI